MCFTLPPEHFCTNVHRCAHRFSLLPARSILRSAGSTCEKPLFSSAHQYTTYLRDTQLSGFVDVRCAGRTGQDAAATRVDGFVDAITLGVIQQQCSRWVGFSRTFLSRADRLYCLYAIAFGGCLHSYAVFVWWCWLHCRYVCVHAVLVF